MQKNLILIDYRATGKTPISRWLGETLQWNIADEWIQKRKKKQTENNDQSGEK
jgi:shikimate kinase